MKFNELFHHNDFIGRHLSLSDRAALLAALGEKDVSSFVEHTVPQSVRMPGSLQLPEALSEADALAKLKGIAAKNRINKSYIGLGYYPTRLPNVILRNVLENPGWYTAYTPYQAEVSQGRLEALLNFQQVCIDLTGFELAGASLLDEATAAAEAMTMARRVGKSKSNQFFVDERVYPQTLDVIKTRAKYFDFELVVGNFDTARNGEYFGALFQYVGKDGDVADLADVIAAVKAKGAIAAVAADIMSLVLLKPPAELGADIALGSTQRFGVPMGFGGPHAAYFAFKDKDKRSAPGRIIGVSVDASGKQALRMALQTREQHIRREKANSNICTSQVLLANWAGMYAVYHGPEGVNRIARRIHALAVAFADAVQAAGGKVVHSVFFDTVAVDFGSKAQADGVYQKALDAGFNLLRIGENVLAAAFSEISSAEEFTQLVELFTGKAAVLPENAPASRLPENLQRKNAILQHPVFNSYHTEHEMLRYLKKLEERDLARFLHHEAECHRRDDSDYLAGIHQRAPVCPERTSARLPGNDPRPARAAQGRYRLRRHLYPAQLRRARRIHRHGDHPPLPRSARPPRAQRVPDSALRPRHQPRHRPHGRYADCDRGYRRARQRRYCRPESQGRTI